MKKSIWIVLLAVILVVSSMLIACTPQVKEPAEAPAVDQPQSEKPAAEQPAKKFVFGQIAHDKNIEWVKYGSESFEAACVDLGVEPVIVDAQNNMEKVLAGMEDLLSKGVDAVSVYSFSPDLDERVAKMAREAGIPVVFENAVPGDNVDRDSVTCCTYYDIGYAVAEFIGNKYPGMKFAYIMGQPGMNITEQYVIGLEDAIKAGAKCEMVEMLPTNWTAEEAMSQTETLIQSGKKYDVIFANNEQIAQGVLNALDAAGLKGKIPVVATGGSPLGIQMLKDGDLDATMAAPTSFMGAMSAKKLFALVNGKTVEAMTNVPLLPATKENVDDIVPWEYGPKVIEAIGGLK
jgi:ABC-type sugar transport system substrate-binding protein